MKRKFFYTIILFLFFFLIEITIGFTFKKEEPAAQAGEFIPISYRISNNLSTTKNTLVVDEMMTEFMKKYDVRGASVAITKDEKLVFAKGFGYANEEQKELTEPKHLFRIASVSKLITAVAIMQLCENNQLEITDTVFGPNGILNDEQYLDFSDSRIKDITIEHLLTHTSGLPGKKGDPLFTPNKVAKELNVDLPVNINQTIQYTLSKKLDATPGKKYSYSNIGYAILGEVIEKVSNNEYEDYVIFNILQPLGINDMHIGKSFEDEKFDHEVSYYDESSNHKCLSFDGSRKLVPFPYGGNNIELLGPAGGWVASAPELMKFIVAVDGFKNKPDILQHKTLEYMISSQKRMKSTIGWRGTDGYGTWWRTGTLSGTSILVMRQNNGINWLVMFNTSIKRRSRVHNYISKTMFEIVRKVNSQWPKHDLFTYYEKESVEPLVLLP